MHSHKQSQERSPSFAAALSTSPSADGRGPARSLFLPLGVAALALAASLGFVPAAQAGGSHFPPCVPLGDCVLYSFCRPPLPPGATWAGSGTGDPVAFEDDAFADDFLGRTSGSGDPACVEVCNHSGALYSYPLGERLDGPGEMGTPEIFVRWTATYTSLVTTTNTSTSGSTAQTTNGQGTGSSSTTSISMTSTVQRFTWVRSGNAEVWPC